MIVVVVVLVLLVVVSRPLVVRNKILTPRHRGRSVGKSTSRIASSHVIPVGVLDALSVGNGVGNGLLGGSCQQSNTLGNDRLGNAQRSSFPLEIAVHRARCRVGRGNNNPALQAQVVNQSAQRRVNNAVERARIQPRSVAKIPNALARLVALLLGKHGRPVCVVVVCSPTCTSARLARGSGGCACRMGGK